MEVVQKHVWVTLLKCAACGRKEELWHHGLREAPTVIDYPSSGEWNGWDLNKEVCPGCRGATPNLLYFQFDVTGGMRVVILNPQVHFAAHAELYDQYLYRKGEDDEEAAEDGVELFDYPEYLVELMEGYYTFEGHTEDEVRKDLIALGHAEFKMFNSESE